MSCPKLFYSFEKMDKSQVIEIDSDSDKENKEYDDWKKGIKCGKEYAMDDSTESTEPYDCNRDNEIWIGDSEDSMEGKEYNIKKPYICSECWKKISEGAFKAPEQINKKRRKNK